MRLGKNSHKRPQGSHKMHYIKNFELNLNSFLHIIHVKSLRVCLVLNYVSIKMYFEGFQQVEKGAISELRLPKLG